MFYTINPIQRFFYSLLTQPKQREVLQLKHLKRLIRLMILKDVQKWEMESFSY